MKEPLRGASNVGEILDDKARVNLTMNPLFGRGTLAKQSAGRVYNVDKENITNGSSSAGDTIIRDHLTPLKSPSDDAVELIAHQKRGIASSPFSPLVASRPIIPPLTPAAAADRQPFTFTATPSLSTLRTSSPATRGSVIYRTVGGRATLTPRRRGSKIITTNPLPHLLESVNHRERASTLSSSSSEDSTQPSPLSFAAGSRIQGPTTPQIKLTKKEQRQHRKSLKVMKKELEHGIRSTISQPYNFVHRLHVEEDLTWKDLSGKEALSNLQLVEKLGEGSYGEVYKARAVTGAILVVKVINIKLDNEESFRKEIDILRECSHTNIVPYYGSIYEQDSVWILMEYCALGSLRDLIDISRPLTESEVAVVCFHTLKALIYLHSRNIIHRDVKAANILLNDQAQVKIADFGVSEQFSGHGAESRTSDKVLGTPLWMAPEVATACALSSSAGKYDFKADVWSLGITVIEMVQGAPPFADMNPMRAMRMVPIRPPPTLAEPEQWSPELNDFIGQCLIKDPNERPRAVDLFMHPFIEQVYSANSEVVLKSLIEEFKEAKEAQASQEQAELLVSASQVRGDSSSASLSSSSASSTSSGRKASAAAAAAMLTAGEFVDLASSDTIIVRRDGDEGEDEEGEEDRAWGTMVVNAEEEADGQFRRMFAPQKEAAEAATAAAEKREKEDVQKAERKANKKKEKRKKRANDTAASKKRKSVEEDGLPRREQAAAVHEALEADAEEEEWEKPISSDGDLLRHSFVDAFDVETQDAISEAPTKKQKKTKKTKSAATTARSKGLKKLRKEQRKEQARESELWRKEEEAERATERQQAMLEESLALDKQLAQIDAILDSIRGAANDQSAPSLDEGDLRSSSVASTPMKMSVYLSPRRKSKIEVRMEKMRSELLAQRKAVPVPFVSAHPASPAPSLASSISSSATVAPVLTTTLTSLVDQPHRLATSAPPALIRRERGQKRYAHEASAASTATRKKQPKAKRPRLEGTELCQGDHREE